MIDKHVLLGHARALEAVDSLMASTLAHDVLETIVGWIPEGWLSPDDESRDPAELHAAYARYLVDRLTAPRPFLPQQHDGC
jgi:hypothetical protein